MTFREPTLSAQLAIFGAVALVTSALSVTTFHYELRALTVGGRDLGFFMASYEHLLDVPPWHGLAAQPTGNDAFGFAGLDGHPTLHHDIHLSPLKYVLALVRAFTRSWWAVQLVLVGSVLAGLAYALVRLGRTGRASTVALASLSAVALSPPFLHGTCHDLRPVTALSGFVVALAAALLTRAPSWHVVLIALLGLSVREDAAVVVALASLWLVLDDRRDDAWRLFAIAAGYALSFHVLYLGFLHFAYAPHAQIAAVWLAFGSPLALLAMPRARIEALQRAHARRRGLTILVLGAPFVAILLDPYFGAHLIRSGLFRSFPATLVAVLAATYWMHTSLSPSAQRRATVALATLGVVGVALGVVSVQRLAHESERGAPVWALARSLPSEATVLTDFAHYQAFAGRDRLLVWERLPAQLEAPGGPESPSLRPALLSVLRDVDALWVVSPASYDALTTALAEAGEAHAIERCEGPTDFVLARRRAGRIACPEP